MEMIEGSDDDDDDLLLDDDLLAGDDEDDNNYDDNQRITVLKRKLLFANERNNRLQEKVMRTITKSVDYVIDEAMREFLDARNKVDPVLTDSKGSCSSNGDARCNGRPYWRCSFCRKAFCFTRNNDCFIQHQLQCKIENVVPQIKNSLKQHCVAQLTALNNADDEI